MLKTIWYGGKDNDVRFSENQNVLKEHGITNPQSFTVTGEVEGLTFIDAPTGQSSGQSQAQVG